MDTNVKEIVKRHVAARLAKAQELGGKATWSTDHHLDMLNEILGTAQSDDARRELLGKHYNVSQMQQELDREFKGTGHFARVGKGQRIRDSLFAELAAKVAQEG